MGTNLKINGVIDRSSPDPAAPLNMMVRWIGMVTVRWSIDGMPRSATAAVLRFDSGGGRAVELWGDHHLALRWLGDRPAPEIASSSYDAILDRGPAHGEFALEVESCPATSSSPSYRTLRASALSVAR